MMPVTKDVSWNFAKVQNQAKELIRFLDHIEESQGAYHTLSLENQFSQPLQELRKDISRINKFLPNVDSVLKLSLSKLPTELMSILPEDRIQGGDSDVLSKLKSQLIYIKKVSSNNYYLLEPSAHLKKDFKGVYNFILAISILALGILIIKLRPTSIL